jgi:Na+-driven multidrug efflux pump
VVPVAFGVLFALSASVGPILGQNLGANLPSRIRQATRDSYVFGISYAVVAALVLALTREHIVRFFGATGETAENLMHFCLYGGIAWVFIGLVLVSNAVFNNLGFPLSSTLFNWSRATLATFPPAYFGAQWMGVKGAIIAMAMGNAIIGVLSVFAAFAAITRVEERQKNIAAIAAGSAKG